MKIIAQTDTCFVSGAGEDIYIEFDVKFNKLPIASLPIILQITEKCMAENCDIEKFTNSIKLAGIDSSLYSIHSTIGFEDIHRDFFI